jgi:hypothetical protein
MTPEKATVLLLDFYCYVLPLTHDRVLVWNESGREKDATVTPPRITFVILSLNQLRAYSDREGAAEALKDQKAKVAYEGGDPVVFEAPTNMEEGTYPISAPKPFLELPEVLVLADYGSEAGNPFDKMFRAIFAFDFKGGQVTVLPQRWFNDGSYDFGYQWITRVQREPASGQIVGEGIRLGKFRLDRSATQVKEWLHRDAFYHPEHEL